MMILFKKKKIGNEFFQQLEFYRVIKYCYERVFEEMQGFFRDYKVVLVISIFGFWMVIIIFLNELNVLL